MTGDNMYNDRPIVNTNPNRTCGICIKIIRNPNYWDIGQTTVNYVPICDFHKGQLESMNSGIYNSWRSFAKEVITNLFTNTEINKHRLEGGGTPICEVNYNDIDHAFIIHESYSLCIYCFNTKAQLEGEEE